MEIVVASEPAILHESLSSGGTCISFESASTEERLKLVNREFIMN